jgi:hypothetical protein
VRQLLEASGHLQRRRQQQQQQRQPTHVHSRVWVAVLHMGLCTYGNSFLRYLATLLNRQTLPEPGSWCQSRRPVHGSGNQAAAQHTFHDVCMTNLVKPQCKH